MTALLETRSRAALKLLDTHLDSNAFALGVRVTMADFSMCGYLYHGDEIGIDFSRCPNIQRWLGDIPSKGGWQHP